MGHFEKCVLAARRGAVQCVAGSSLATLIMPCITAGSSESIMVGRESKKKLYQDDRG